MSSSAPSKFECSKCKIFKNVNEYTLDKYKQPYPRCKLCFNADNVEYWSKQVFKVCGTCKVDKPLRKFNKWNNVPHRNCQKCWEAEYVKKRAEGREKAAGNKRVGISGECARRPTALLPEADNMRVLYQRAIEERANIQRRMDVDPEGCYARYLQPTISKSKTQTKKSNEQCPSMLGERPH